MKYRNDLKYYIQSDRLVPIEQFDEQIFEEGESVYEVVRIMAGKPLFLDEHLNRMQQSLDLAYGDFQFSKNALKEALFLLVDANKVSEGNIKIELRKKNGAFERLLYFIPHRYPDDTQIQYGIRMRFQFDERPLPNAKISNWAVRGNANRIIDSNQIYETLLVNSEGFVTEGSRSNIFFIKNGKLYSAPEEWILQGITRNKVVDICRSLDIEIVHQRIHFKELSQFESAFITGTSPGVLQVRQIERFNFKIGHIIYKQIYNSYQSLFLK